MAKSKEEKTNVMRILEQKRIPYLAHYYEEGASPLGDREYGLHIAESMGQPPERVFKTLVAQGASKAYYVFCIPVAESLELKRAAKSVGEKSVELLAVRQLNAVTGYIRGGCSPIGMKKQFRTVFHSTAVSCERVYVSAGKIGCQVELAPADIMALLGASSADIIV